MQKGDINPNNHQLLFNGRIIKKVIETKFLGVIVDENLSWKPHIAKLNKKLKSACGRLYRIINCLPSHLHKQIYHSLFESHLTYGISVWGGVSKCQLDPIFRTQKKCIRIIFGDTNAYLQKFQTCVRAREYGMQRLGKDFYINEPSKPLFNKYQLLTVHNLYRHRCIMELLKIVKNKEPCPLYQLFNRSKQNENRFITPVPSHNFIYKAPWLWNQFKQILDLAGYDFTAEEKSIKSILKQSLYNAQIQPNLDNWAIENFTEFGHIEN